MLRVNKIRRLGALHMVLFSRRPALQILHKYTQRAVSVLQRTRGLSMGAVVNFCRLTWTALDQPPKITNRRHAKVLLGESDRKLSILNTLR